MKRIIKFSIIFLVLYSVLWYGVTLKFKEYVVQFLEINGIAKNYDVKIGGFLYSPQVQVTPITLDAKPPFFLDIKFYRVDFILQPLSSQIKLKFVDGIDYKEISRGVGKVSAQRNIKFDHSPIVIIGMDIIKFLQSEDINHLKNLSSAIKNFSYKDQGYIVYENNKIHSQNTGNNHFSYIILPESKKLDFSFHQLTLHQFNETFSTIGNIQIDHPSNNQNKIVFNSFEVSLSKFKMKIQGQIEHPKYDINVEVEHPMHLIKFLSNQYSEIDNSLIKDIFEKIVNSQNLDADSYSFKINNKENALFIGNAKLSELIKYYTVQKLHRKNVN